MPKLNFKTKHIIASLVLLACVLNLNAQEATSNNTSVAELSLDAQTQIVNLNALSATPQKGFYIKGAIGIHNNAIVATKFDNNHLVQAKIKGTGALLLKSDAMQNIVAIDSELNNLIIDNATEVVLKGELKINNKLSIINGIFNTINANLVVDDNATVEVHVENNAQLLLHDSIVQNNHSSNAFLLVINQYILVKNNKQDIENKNTALLLLNKNIFSSNNSNNAEVFIDKIKPPPKNT